MFVIALFYIVPYGNHGCQGGNVHNVYQYVVDNQGINTEASYPYKGRVSSYIHVECIESFWLHHHIWHASITIYGMPPPSLQQAQCQFNKSYIGATQTGVVVIPSGNEDDLQAATATAGPVSVAVDASSNAFRVS